MYLINKHNFAIYEANQFCSLSTYLIVTRGPQYLYTAVLLFALGNNILPRVQVEPNNISVRQGAEVTLICKTSSQLPVTISWSRADKSPLDENHSTRRNVLVIRNIKNDDQGTYICLARNSFGASKATAELTVIKS